MFLSACGAWQRFFAARFRTVSFRAVRARVASRGIMPAHSLRRRLPPTRLLCCPGPRMRCRLFGTWSSPPQQSWHPGSPGLAQTIQLTNSPHSNAERRGPKPTQTCAIKPRTSGLKGRLKPALPRRSTMRCRVFGAWWSSPPQSWPPRPQRARRKPTTQSIAKGTQAVSMQPHAAAIKLATLKHATLFPLCAFARPQVHNALSSVWNMVEPSSAVLTPRIASKVSAPRRKKNTAPKVCFSKPNSNPGRRRGCRLTAGSICRGARGAGRFAFGRARRMVRPGERS